MLAPSGFGKTSLMTAVLQEALFATGAGKLNMIPVDTPTEERLNRNRRELEARLTEGKFDAHAIRGTTERFDFEAEITYGRQNVISVLLRDFPGAWLSEPRRGEQTRPLWDETVRFIRKSSILLVPVDAVLVMESARAGRRAEFSELAALDRLRSGVRRWTEGRRENAHEPALALICPVKCESYFADNGGSRDAAVELRETVVSSYANVLQPLRELKEAVPDTTILYAPVDTIGCVELTGVQWDGPVGMDASYQIREPSKISRAGAGDVMRVLHHHLLRVQRTSLSAADDSESGQARELDLLLHGDGQAYGPRVHEL
jgi:hypothetical protein